MDVEIVNVVIDKKLITNAEELYNSLLKIENESLIEIISKPNAKASILELWEEDLNELVIKLVD